METDANVLLDTEEDIVKNVSIKKKEALKCYSIFSINFAAKCKGGCKNGGTCIAPDTCQCQSGFEGINCQRRKSSLVKKNFSNYKLTQKMQKKSKITLKM